MRFGPAYYEAKQMQTVLFAIACKEKTPAREAVQCTRAWVELERFKREMRGIPPLAPHSLNEMPMKRLRGRVTALAEPEPIEQEPKESLCGDQP